MNPATYTLKRYKNILKTYQITKKTENYRADIVDIDGSFIAKSVITYNVGIKPNLINDKKKFLLKLKYSFPELDFQKKSLK